MQEIPKVMRLFLCLLLRWPGQIVQALTAEELLQFFEATHGAVQFRRDLYGRDAPLVAALRRGGAAP